MEFLLLSLGFMLSPFFFLFLLVMFSFSMLNSFCWGGMFFYCDSYSFLVLIFMSLFILGVILLGEKNFVLLILSELLVLFCIFFFIPGSLLMLYMFFELSMFPILVMILAFGSQIEKVNSAYYLIFYASFCSFPFLFVYFSSNIVFSLVYFSGVYSWEVMFLLSLSFMMKFPVFFLHLWLPKAHVEAPTTASMLLAGLLLKLGTAGFLRILPSFKFCHGNFWMILGFLGMILASFSCLFQSDAKSLAAYSSVTHMSFLLMSLVFVFMSGKTGGLLMMLAHGYTSTLMFYLIGEFYHISSSRMVYYLNSYFSSSVFMALVFSFVMLSNSGVPPSVSFLSEFVVVSNVLNIFGFGFWMMFCYFFLAFYYSIYFLTSALMGKSLVSFNIWNVGFCVPLVIMMYNIFWLSIFL